jgi:ComF family protein
MARSWQEHGAGQIDAVVPMPLHWTRATMRGYNQAALLAEGVGARLGVPVRRVLRRCRRTKRQTTLDVDSRQRNVRGAFRARAPRADDRGHLVLVDDVCTTGATLADATRALLAGGADKVSVLTVARG